MTFLERKIIGAIIGLLILAVMVLVWIYILRDLHKSLEDLTDLFTETFGRKRKGSKATDAAATLEEKLEVLARCGIKLAEPFTVDDLLQSWDRAEYEKNGYDATLVGLGMTEEQEPWRNHCVNLWHFDTECIEDDGSYKQIAERMAEMAQGSLPITNIRDHVDIENKQAWLAFDFQGKETKINCKVRDDWVDHRVFATFAGLLARSDPSKTYIYYDLGGQDCIIGCVTREELHRLRVHGIRFEAMG